MQRLIAGASCKDVARASEERIDKANVGCVLHVANAEGQLDIVGSKRVQQDEEVCKRLVMGYKNDALFLLHQALDVLYARLLYKQALAQLSEDLDEAVEDWRNEAWID